MKCPECNYSMDFEVLVLRGGVWICNRCGRTLKEGTAHLNYPIYTNSSEVSF